MTLHLAVAVSSARSPDNYSLATSLCSQGKTANVADGSKAPLWQSVGHSFDHIVGAPEQGEREADTERLGGRRQAASDRFEGFKAG
jgi:hypothetical protein